MRKAREEELVTLNEMRDSCLREAERIIFEVFPAKITQLDETLKKHFSETPPSFVVPIDVVPEETGVEEHCLEGLGTRRLASVSADWKGDGGTEEEAGQEPPSKRAKMQNGASSSAPLSPSAPRYIKRWKPIPSNERLLPLTTIIKEEVMELISNLNAVKTWIQLNIPRIEDGNNFGVAIQGDTLQELTRVEESAFDVIENITKYFLSRGKLLQTLCKYPHIADYAKCIYETDEKQFINMRISCVDLRTNYAVLLDMITKNMDKLRKPRNESNAMHMF